MVAVGTFTTEKFLNSGKKSPVDRVNNDRTEFCFDCGLGSDRIDIRLFPTASRVAPSFLTCSQFCASVSCLLCHVTPASLFLSQFSSPLATFSFISPFRVSGEEFYFEKLDKSNIYNIRPSIMAKMTESTSK